MYLWNLFGCAFFILNELILRGEQSMYIGTMQIYQNCGEHVGSSKITMAKILNLGDVSIICTS